MRLAGPPLAAVLAAGLALAGCGDDEAAPADRFTSIPKRTIQAPSDKTAPRWQQIAVLRGDGAASKRVTVAREALQWRVRWRCRTGAITITVAPAPADSDGRAAGRCPGGGSATWVGAGVHAIAVRSQAAFRAVVEEELRTPLHEPAPAAVRSGAAREIARGSFRPVELKGRGSAALYRLAGGRLALRIEDFATDPNPDLDVWLSAAADPSTTRRIFRAAHTSLGSLKATIGDQNYLLPAGSDARRIRSVVVVNAGQRIAYTAARLDR